MAKSTNENREPVRFLVFPASMRKESLNKRLSELAKEVIEKNAGRIWVESEFGAGSTFSFNLPVENGSAHS